MSAPRWIVGAALGASLAASLLAFRVAAQITGAMAFTRGDAGMADASADASPRECAEGTNAVGGHCCPPGQQWRTNACTGAPTSCAPGHVIGRVPDAGTGCIPRACEASRERAADGVHCCFPGQRWDARALGCRGDEARCPEGTALGASDCAPAVSIAFPNAPAAGPAGMLWVGGGTFRMGARDATARHVTLGPFWIGRTEVSAAEYARCVTAGRCAARSDPFAVSGAGTLPAANVSHEMARAYCAWSGGRLPTEAEWEFAARGIDGRTYPWGERLPSCDLARVQGCATSPAAVGSLRLGASPFGLLDMAGNLAEWTADRWASTPPSGSVRDPVGPTDGRTRVVRGGAFDSAAAAVRTTARVARDAGEARYDVGFRCVRTGAVPAASTAQRPHPASPRRP